MPNTLEKSAPSLEVPPSSGNPGSQKVSRSTDRQIVKELLKDLRDARMDPKRLKMLEDYMVLIISR